MQEPDKHHAKFSHRLFAQYFVAAIIPVMVLALISFYTVTGLLKKNAERQIYAESRAVGLTLYDRLLTIESNLVNFSQLISSGHFVESDAWAQRMFVSLAAVEKKGDADFFFGNDNFTYDLDQINYQHLEQGKRILLPVFKEGGAIQVYMVHLMDVASQRLLVAELNPEYLWGITIKEDDFFCVALNKDTLLNCPNSIKQTENHIFHYLNNGEENSLLEVTVSEISFLGNGWELFLQPNFLMEKMTIIYFMPKKNAFLEYNYYKDALPLSISITMLLVFIFSSVQMRRALLPLNKLIQGAKNMIAGDYKQTVEINSNDEFETLALTFNDMSHRIDDQFTKIKTLAKIDRLILSTSDTDYIVEVLFEYIPTVIPADHIAIMILEPDLSSNGTLFYKTDPDSSLKKTDLILNDEELKELRETDGVLKKNVSDKNLYLSTLIKLGNKTLLVNPIKNKDEVLGLICIGQMMETDTFGSKEDLTEISDRVAVAISDANWEKKIMHQAHYDALTSLPNRFLFKDRLEQAIERASRNDLNVAVLFIDLDRFKTVNDSLGHSVGDDVLMAVSKLLLQCVRSYDSVSRFGGDEFTIIISDLKDEEVEEQTERLSKRILETMSEPIVISDREFYITPSIGIAIYPRDAKNFSDLLKNADTAMYEAKSISSGNYQYYQKQQNKETLALLELENELRHAIEEDQLELYYQPKIDLRDCKIYDVEALVRWNHPEHGLISPGVFIPLAEKTGLIVSIGYWVMNQACQQNKIWHELGYNLNVAVNISPDQFRQPGLYDKVLSILNETGVDPGSIELEITESLTIENFPKTVRLLNQFREHGLGICIDDFGTGYSSMTYLQKIPITKLKIDKSFIDNIHLHEDSASITKAIVALGHNLSLRVVAEGVETKAQYDYLNAINCDEAQGFFLCRPLPESNLIEHILLYNSTSSNVS